MISAMRSCIFQLTDLRFFCRVRRRRFRWSCRSRSRRPRWSSRRSASRRFDRILTGLLIDTHDHVLRYIRGWTLENDVVRFLGDVEDHGISLLRVVIRNDLLHDISDRRQILLLQFAHFPLVVLVHAVYFGAYLFDL